MSDRQEEFENTKQVIRMSDRQEEIEDTKQVIRMSDRHDEFEDTKQVPVWYLQTLLDGLTF
jgi:glutaredoxin-related protein